MILKQKESIWGLIAQSLNKKRMLLKLRKDFHAKCFGDDRGRLFPKALDQC